MRIPGPGKLVIGLALLATVGGITLRLSHQSGQKENSLDDPGLQTQAPKNHSPDTKPSISTQERHLPSVASDWRSALTNRNNRPELPREEVEKYLEHNRR